MSRVAPVGLAVLALAVAAGAVTVAAGADPDGPDPSSDLAAYTDPGDACAQAISAIGYLDGSLRALGQEPYQEFDDLVRSKLSAVAGTLSLEARDWPTDAARGQADVVQQLAAAAGARSPRSDAERVHDLLRYRIEAGRLVELCRYPPTRS